MKNEKDTSTRGVEPLSFSDELARTVLDSLSAHIAILDENGVILETNKAWRTYAVNSGMPETYAHRGVNYLEICEATTGSEAAGIQAVIRGQQQEFLFDYPCHSEEGPHWYYMRTIRVKGPGPIRVVVSHEEITSLKLTEEALKKSQEELFEQKQSLEEANIALKVLLKQREADKQELEKKVLTNVKDLVLPYVEKLKNSRLKPRDKTLVEIVETHLNDVISPLLQRFANAKILLTPQEMQVANLVKDGQDQQRNRRYPECLRSHSQFSPQKPAHQIRLDSSKNQSAILPNFHVLAANSSNF